MAEAAGKPKKEEVYYELMPHKKIKKIKKEIETLKKKAETESFTSKSFMSSVSSLTKSIDSLMELFKEATEGMKLEEQAEEEVSKKLAPLLGRMDDIEEQNRKIAEGIVTVADMVAELKEEIEKLKKIPPEMPRIRPMPRPKIVMPPEEPRPPKPEKKPAPPPRFPPLGPMPGARPMPPLPEERPMPPPPWEKPGAPPPPIPPGPPPGPTPPGPFPEIRPERKKKGLLGGLFKK